jgi:hypothetical protein
MADDLIARQGLIGKSRTEVEDLLGVPDRKEGRQERAYYWTGPERHFISIDSEWLTVQYDVDGVVTDVMLTSD